MLLIGLVNDMKWLEIIELRMAGKQREPIGQVLSDLEANSSNRSQTLEMKIFKHATIETDYSIHLIHLSGSAQIHGSTLGLRVADALKEFGLVNYNVWVPSH